MFDAAALNNNIHKRLIFSKSMRINYLFRYVKFFWGT